MSNVEHIKMLTFCVGGTNKSVILTFVGVLESVDHSSNIVWTKMPNFKSISQSFRMINFGNNWPVCVGGTGRS